MTGVVPARALLCQHCKCSCAASPGLIVASRCSTHLAHEETQLPYWPRSRSLHSCIGMPSQVNHIGRSRMRHAKLQIGAAHTSDADQVCTSGRTSWKVLYSSCKEVRSRLEMTIDPRLQDLMRHLRGVAVTRWGHAIADDFFSKQLPHNVTWGLTLLYAIDRSGDFEQVQFLQS